MSATPQCALCLHGRRNYGKVIPVGEVDWFCGRLEGERTATSEVLTLMLLRDAQAGRCAAYTPYPATPDGYLSEDLPPDGR